MNRVAATRAGLGLPLVKTEMRRMLGYTNSTRTRRVHPQGDNGGGGSDDVRLDVPNTDNKIHVREDAQNRCSAFFKRKFNATAQYMQTPQGKPLGCIIGSAITVVTTLSGFGVFGSHAVSPILFPGPSADFSANDLLENLKKRIAEDGFQMSQQLDAATIMPLVKEASDFVMCNETEFWNKYRPTVQIEGDSLSNTNIAFQIGAIEMLSIYGESDRRMNPPWAWIMPSDGAGLVLELALAYKEKGPDAMYGHIRDYRYGRRKVILPRTVACDAITTALTTLYSPLEDETKAEALQLE
ncbi:hypothetical protein E8E11_001304 [Didymella keratinophila]|nr:hypothetical protein E8E11_001304 [Didymella keratinophila]